MSQLMEEEDTSKDRLQNRTLKKHREMKEITFLIFLWERIKFLLKKIGNCLLKKCKKYCKQDFSCPKNGPFPLQRKVIVKMQPLIKTMLGLWPSLFTELEVRNLIVIAYLHLFHWLNDLFCKFLQNVLGLPGRTFWVNCLVNLTDTHPV